MKRQGNLLSFAFFGLTAQAIALLLLGQLQEAQVTGFLFAATGFMLYRAFIREQNREMLKDAFVYKELRRWWIRQEPENTFSFALFGGMLLVACNYALWQSFRLIDIWAYSFVAVGLSQVLFEQSRQLFNSSYAYLLEKARNRRLKKLKNVVGGEDKLWEKAIHW